MLFLLYARFSGDNRLIPVVPKHCQTLLLDCQFVHEDTLFISSNEEHLCLIYDLSH